MPHRKRKLPDPLELLVATILSQNTNDVNSHRAFTNLKNVFPDFLSLANAQPRKIESLIKVGGIASKKSKTIVRIVREIKSNFEKFDCRSLRRFARENLIEKLCTMNGIGYKTASCVSLFALGDDDAFPVDTHVHRILNRLGIVKEKTPDKTYLGVKDLIPHRRGYELHINLIKFGRKVCTAQKPKCCGCLLFDLCNWKEKTLQVPDKAVNINKKRVEFMVLEKV
ncbi:MAG: endonuclease III [Candidatus Kryptoniota bacterium]